MKGGYQIVDLHRVSIKQGFTEIPGVYEAIEGNYYKPILLDGLVIDGKEMPAVFTSATIEDGSYNLPVYNGRVVVTDSDQVEFLTNA